MNQYNAFHATANNFFSMVSFTHVDYENLVAFATGVHASNLNPAIVKRIDPLLSTSLTACRSFYANKNLPWTLVLPAYLSSDVVEQLLEDHGLELVDKGVAMAISINDFQFPSIESLLTIKKVEGDLNVWSIPLNHAFEATPEITDTYTTRHAQASQENAHLYHFSGFINDTVICSLSLSLCDDHARIDDVATMPAYQKRGYATQLMYAALQHAQRLNTKICFLEASTDGLSLYKRMGFEQLFINHYYEPRGIDVR